MDMQQNTKKGNRNLEDNKLYIQFLKNCELEHTPSQPFSPNSASASGVRSHGNSYSNKNSNPESNQSNYNLQAFGIGKTQINNNNLQSSVQLKVGNLNNINNTNNNTPQSATQAINTLFDLLLKKHDYLYKEITQIQSTKGKKPIFLHHTKSDDKKLKNNNNNDFTTAVPGDSRRNTILAQNLFTNIDENVVQQNQLLKEEQIKVIYKNPNSSSIQKFKVKIVPLIIQEPLLAISLQDITQNEEEKKVKKMEQDNNAINLQVIAKIKSHIEYLFQNLSKIKGQKMKQAVIFPLNIIRSTAAIDKNKITYEQFGVNSLLKDLVSLFPNFTQLRIKNNPDQPSNQSGLYSNQKNNNLVGNNEFQSWEDQLKEFDLIDPQSFEELDDLEIIKQQEETIAKKYNLAQHISANHDFLSFSVQEKQFNRQKSNFSMQTIGTDNLNFKGNSNYVDSEYLISNLNFQKKNNQNENIKNKINSCLIINYDSQTDNDIKQTVTAKTINDAQDNTLTVNRIYQKFHKSISNEDVLGKKDNKNINKFSQNNFSHILNTTPQRAHVLPQSKSSISYKIIKPQTASQINNKLKQLDDNPNGRNNSNRQQELKHKLISLTVEDIQKRGPTLQTTTTTGFSQQQPGGSFTQTKLLNQIEKEDSHEDLTSEKVSNRIQSFQQNNPNLSSINKIISDQNLIAQNLNQQTPYVIHQRDDRCSSVGQVSSNNFPSVNQIDLDVNNNQIKKQQGLTTSSKFIDLGLSKNLYANFLGENKNQDASVFMNNYPNIKTSTQLETECNDVMSEKDKKLNNLFNNPSRNTTNQTEMQILSNKRLIFQVLSGIITCFGKQDVQIVVENQNKKLYNSIKFTCMPANYDTNKNVNQNIQKNEIQKQVFNFENYPSLNNSPQLNTYQLSMFPNINTLTQNMLSPTLNDNNPQQKQITPAKITKFQLLSPKKPLITEEDFKKNLYDIHYFSNRHLCNKIWNSIKDIASLLGPQKLEFSENTISIELFTNMNIVKSKQISTNAPFQMTKPNRNSIFSIQHNYNQMIANNGGSQSNFNNIQFNPLNSNITHYTPQLNGQPNSAEKAAQSIINVQNSSIVLANVVNNNYIFSDPNNSIVNAYQNVSRLDPQSTTNKNSFNNLNQNHNNSVSYQQNLQQNIKQNDQVYRTPSQQSIKISKQLPKVQTIFPSQQQVSNQPFLVNSKLRIPEEEEQSPYKKRHYSQISLSLMSLQSQQDEGVNQVQPIKNFLNQNAKFNI